MKLLFHPEIRDDINQLDRSIKVYLKKALNKLKKSPELGIPLGNKGDLDSAGCKKLYFYKKKYRIVYEKLDENKVIIWSIGKRENQLVYLNAYKRILENNY
ncbi:MAG: type II toxin-antitoxin system RelE/ParE family toxin [Bacillota bacterium]